MASRRTIYTRALTPPASLSSLMAERPQEGREYVDNDVQHRAQFKSHSLVSFHKTKQKRLRIWLRRNSSISRAPSANASIRRFFPIWTRQNIHLMIFNLICGLGRIDGSRLFWHKANNSYKSCYTFHLSIRTRKPLWYLMPSADAMRTKIVVITFSMRPTSPARRSERWSAKMNSHRAQAHAMWK